MVTNISVSIGVFNGTDICLFMCFSVERQSDAMRSIGIHDLFGILTIYMSDMIADNPLQIRSTDVQSNGAPVAPIMTSADLMRRKKAEGTIHCQYVFIPAITLEKGSPILGKLCRCRLIRYVALKVVDLCLQLCNAGFVWAHVSFPFIMGYDSSCFPNVQCDPTALLRGA